MPIQNKLLAIGACTIFAVVLLSACGSKGTPESTLAETADYQTAMEFYNQNKVDSAIVYFGKLTRAYPDATAAWAWYAESARRLGKMDKAESAGKKAIEIDSGNSFAHTVLGDLYNPQYSMWEKVDSDFCYNELKAAVDVNPDEGNAWLSLWIEAMRRDDKQLEKKSLKRLYELGFFTRPVLAQNRWLLENLPENAIFITNGDLDTYPALMLQQEEQLRTDVALVNVSLLNMPWYVEDMAKRHNLPMPMTYNEMMEYSPYNDKEGRIDLLSHVVMNAWIEDENHGRPFTASVTCGDHVFQVFQPGKMLKGSCYTVAPSPDELLDPDAVKAAIAHLDGSLYSGVLYTERDKSAVRRAAEPGFTAKVPFNTGLLFAEYCLENDMKNEAKSTIAMLRRFAKDARLGKEDVSRLKMIEKNIL